MFEHTKTYKSPTFTNKMNILETEQAKKWEGNFGDEYTDRNPQTKEAMDELYQNNFGITRAQLNKDFLDFLPKDIKILEVGCNVGTQLAHLKALGFNNLTGVEISDYALNKAKQNDPNINFLKASALSLPFADNSFDFVFTSGVLIHIHPEDVKKAIDEFHRVSKKYIWGFEYYSEQCKEIEYHGNKELLWKNDFMNLFLQRHSDLEVVNNRKLKYLGSENRDEMFLLQKMSMGQENDFIINKFPRVLRIEPASLCNLKCAHCPTGTVDMPRKVMGWEVFEKILGEIKENLDAIKVVVLYHGGEPLLNRYFFKMVEELKKINMPKVKTVTNGMMLTAELCLELIKSGIDEIEVSLDGTSEEVNDKIRKGSSYRKVVENLKLLCEKKKELCAAKPVISVTSVQFLNNGDVKGFEIKEPQVPENLINEFEGFDVNFKPCYAIEWPVMNIDASIFEKIKVNRPILNYCDHVINTMTIRADGVVVPCCYDLTTQCPLGNVLNESLKDIWNNPKYVALRKSIYEGGENPLCRNCETINKGLHLSLKRREPLGGSF